ncbi:hypothetical protein [Bifidobacterium pullorum]|uniref:hypothetical protein n=1 Tax=Bifidobacterium pullorum TaxID=78448 RepID=UPI00052A0FBD|nr:hypothetical protein [Bifidobacterium pullorum]
MPWWIWLLLVLFMLVMLLAGLGYAAWHLWKGFRKVADTGAVIGEHMAAFDDVAASSEPDMAPAFTQPLRATMDRYSDAHADVIRRRAGKRERHVEAWSRWRRFNND